MKRFVISILSIFIMLESISLYAWGPMGHDVVAAIAEKAELKKVDAEKALNAFVEAVTEALAKGDKIALVGFGTFEVRARAERKGRNPKTGETIKIAAAKKPVFSRFSSIFCTKRPQETNLSRSFSLFS